MSKSLINHIATDRTPRGILRLTILVAGTALWMACGPADTEPDTSDSSGASDASIGADPSDFQEELWIPAGVPDLEIAGYLLTSTPDEMEATITLVAPDGAPGEALRLTALADGRWSFAVPASCSAGSPCLTSEAASATYVFTETPEGGVLSRAGQHAVELRFSTVGGFERTGVVLSDQEVQRLNLWGQVLQDVGTQVAKNPCGVRCRIARFFIRAGCVLTGIGCCLGGGCSDCITTATECWNNA